MTASNGCLDIVVANPLQARLTLMLKDSVAGLVLAGTNFKEPSVTNDRLEPTAVDPLLILSPDRKIKDLNEAAEQVFGVARDDLLGHDAIHLFDDSALAKEAIEIILALGSASDVRLSIRSSAGRTIDTSVHASVYKNGGGSPEAIIMFLRDISEQLRQEQELKYLAAIVEDSNDAIYSLSIHGVVKSWNTGAEHIYGYSRDEMIGSLITQLHAPSQTDELTELLAKLRENHSSIDRYETQHKRKDGQHIHVSLMLSPIKDADGQIIGASAISRDITKEKLLAEALIKERNSITGANQVLSKQAIRLARQASQMESLAEMSGLLQVCETDDEVYFVISQFSEKLFPDASGALYIPGNDDRSVLERTVNWGIALPANDAFPTSDCFASHRAQAHTSSRGKISDMCAHLSHRHDDHTYMCAPIVLRGELLGVVCLEWAVREVVPEDESLTVRVLGDAALALANLRLRQKLRELSVRDPLTGLFNRRYMEEFFGQELVRSRRQSRSLSLLVFDIDHFKNFNDTYGHEAGDAVLHDLGLFLRKNVRGSDVICRYGGEEIVVLLPETPLEAAIGRADFVLKNVRELVIESAGTVLPQVTMSIGVASFPLHGDSIEAIFRAADAAMYRAKEAGRNRVEIASELPVPS